MKPEPSQPATAIPSGSLPRLALVAVILAVFLGAFAYTGGWLTPHALTADRVVDRFQQLNGPHPGFRRNHAKGVCVTGTFQSNGNGVAYSKAALFQPGSIRVVGRFAFAGGMPNVPDSPHLVRSLAVLLETAKGEEWRMALINIPLFPVHTPEEFFEFMLASAPDKATGKPDPVKMKAFLEAHPGTAKALPQIGAAPVSSGFPDTTYNSLNAFRFINAAGLSTPVRWSLVPNQPFQPIDPAAPPADAPNYLFDALIASIHRQPLQWHLILTIGQPGDPTNDASIPWPADRPKIDVGTLTIDRIESEDTSPTRDINFDPLILPDGIAASDDPLLSARSAAYSESFTRREGEPKSPSAVSPTEVSQ